MFHIQRSEKCENFKWFTSGASFKKIEMGMKNFTMKQENPFPNIHSFSNLFVIYTA